MNNQINNFSDETGEVLLETGKKVVKNVGKTAIQSVKGQIVGSGQNQIMDQSGGIKDKVQDNGNKKIDPVTGRPVIGKKLLTHLNLQVAQLAQMRIKKVREELEKQRLKTSGQVPGSSDQEQTKPKEDVISKVLKASKSTGEFGKNIGG